MVPAQARAHARAECDLFDEDTGGYLPCARRESVSGGVSGGEMAAAAADL